MIHDQKQITEHFASHKEDYAYVKMISDTDYGCEERDDRQLPKSYVALQTRYGEASQEIEDSILDKEHLTEGTYITRSTYDRIFSDHEKLKSLISVL